MFYGNLVALVTPMTDNGAIDYASFEQLVEWQLAEGSDGIVLLGTTGESPTILPAERNQLIRQAAQQIAGRVPLIVGTGTNSTQSTIELTQQALGLGADACLLIAPYYNRPTQEGLYQHFAAVAHAVPIPLILYNHPLRTGTDLLPETLYRLASIPNIVAHKEASNELARIPAMVEQLAGRISLFGGNDDQALEFLRLGGKGVISVTANVAPKAMTAFCKFSANKEWQQAAAIDQSLQIVHHALAVTSNPIPVKWALYAMNKVGLGIRLPLILLPTEYHDVVRSALRQAGLLGSSL